MRRRKFSWLLAFFLIASLMFTPGIFAFGPDGGGGPSGGDFSGPPSGGDYGPPSGGSYGPPSDIPSGGSFTPPSGWSGSYTGPMGPGGPSLGPNGPMGMPPGFTPPPGGMPDISQMQQGAIQQAMSQMQAGMSAAQQQAMQSAMQQAMQLTGVGAMPDFSKMVAGTDFNKIPAGAIPAGLMPSGGFKPGEIPSQALPAGMKLPEGMTLPPSISAQFDMAVGQFKGPNGETLNFQMPTGIAMPKDASGKSIEIPNLSDGRVVPMPFAEMPKPGQVMDTKEFADKFFNTDMTQLKQLSVESLDALFANATADKLDISKPEVQQKMEQVYQARNQQFGVGDVTEKLKILNAGIPTVQSVSVESLNKEIATLQGLIAKGNTDPKIQDALTKCIDAKNSQVRANGIYQQIAQLKTLQESMEQRGKNILTSISNMGLNFTPKEQQELELEIATIGEGTVPGLEGKIKTLEAKYSEKIKASGAAPGDFVKMATVYEKLNDTTKAFEVLSQGMAKNPDDDSIITKLATLNMNAGKLDDACAVVEGAMKNNPVPQTRALYSEIKEKQGDLPTAVNYMEKAIKDAPNESAFYQKAGELYNKAGQGNDFKVFATGSKVAFDTPPKLENSRTLVPIRAISESLGSQVNWDDKTKKAEITLDGKKVELTLNSTNAVVDGTPVKLDVPAKIDNGRIMVPLRFVGESFNKTVDYIPDGRVIAIK